MRFTLDMNCVIDAEENAPSGQFVKDLVALNGTPGVTIGVPAICAAERLRGTQGYARNFAEFKARLKAVGFHSLDLLAPIAYWDITFWDYCVVADEADTLERDIHRVLFPNQEFEWHLYASSRGRCVDVVDRKWKNNKCDVLGMWCHIRHRGDVFVTRDKNFQKKTKLRNLKALGAGAILDPQEALALV